MINQNNDMFSYINQISSLPQLCLYQIEWTAFNALCRHIIIQSDVAHSWNDDKQYNKSVAC